MYKNYTTDQLVLPLDLTQTIPKNDIAYPVHHLVESIPEEAFEHLKHQRGASSYHPRMMLKIILCAYTQSVFSGRRIDRYHSNHFLVSHSTLSSIWWPILLV